MCGIAGVFNNDKACSLAIRALEVLQNRGKDCFGVSDGKKTVHSESLQKLPQLESRNAIAHALHSVVGVVAQPLGHCFVANCEIYNWKELVIKHGISAKNDAELLFGLMQKKIGLLDEVDGVYSFALWHDCKLIIARDIIGEKPLWYSHADGFYFASEKKALAAIGCLDIVELNPRKILVYDLTTDRLELRQRSFFLTKPLHRAGIDKNLLKLLESSVKKRVPGQKFGLLFSGGLDSSVLAVLLKKLGCEFTCYVAGCIDRQRQLPEDLLGARKAADALGLKLKIVTVDLHNVPELLKVVVPLIEDTSVTKVSVALPFFAACRQAKKDGCRVIFSGLGSEELFAGYERHRNSLDINQECLAGLLKMYERDLYRDDVVTMNNGLELRTPFLDTRLVGYSLRIPPKKKLGSEDKLVLRGVARKIGIPEFISGRKKRAAQYGSNFLKGIDKLSRRSGHKTKSSYLSAFYPNRNLRLAVLFSSGKDSCYAMHVMTRQNYDISCLVTLQSKNPDSYMFHSPVGLAQLQAEAMGIPIILHETEGEKESELADLKKALEKAKDSFKVDGVVTGALFSNYQRERIERIADDLGLKVFHPLWHLNQESEMREIIDAGYKFILVKVAADGLDKSWLGREITHKDVDRLVSLNKKNRINIAFEGGEAESLVLDCPLFKKRILIKALKMRMTSACDGLLDIAEAVLEEKNEETLKETDKENRQHAKEV